MKKIIVAIILVLICTPALSNNLSSLMLVNSQVIRASSAERIRELEKKVEELTKENEASKKRCSCDENIYSEPTKKQQN